jgi:hypothetical protein
MFILSVAPGVERLCSLENAEIINVYWLGKFIDQKYYSI